MNRLPLVGIVSALTFTFRVAFAQYGGPPPPPPIISLQLAASQSRMIFVGTIAAVSKQPPDYERKTATLDVMSTLLGDRVGCLEINSKEYAASFKSWHAGRNQLLVMVPKNIANDAVVIDLSNPNLAVFTEDLKVLRSSAEVLGLLRSYLKATAGKAEPRFFRVRIPASKDTPIARDYSGGRNKTVEVRVPIDSNLEKLAHREIDSIEEQARINGIEALAEFKSDYNLRLLNQLLRDDRWSAPSYQVANNKLLKMRFNYTRQAAYNSLRILNQKAINPNIVHPVKAEDQVISVNLDKENVSQAEIESLREYPNLKDLYLSNAKLSGDQFRSISKLRSLQTLFLESSNVTNADLNVICHLPNVVYLGLTNTEVTDSGVDALSKFRSLKKIDLGVKVTENGAARLRKMRPDVEVRSDPLAFLLALHPRIEEYPHLSANWIFLPVGMAYEEAVGLRCTSYYFPRESADKVEGLLSHGLPKEIWTKTPMGYSREGVPIKGNYGNRNLDQIRTEMLEQTSSSDYFGMKMRPGERLLIFTRNVNPRPID